MAPVQVQPASDAVEKLRKRGDNAPRSDEVARIVSMPVSPEMTPAEVDEFSKQHLLRQAYNDGFRLLPTQANGLREYQTTGGLFAPIPVGQGKTLLSLMIADHAFRNGHERMMLSIPPEVLGQLVGQDIQFARTHAPISYPIHVMGGRQLDVRRSMARSKKPGLYVFPYSLLSTKDTDDNLADIQPSIIIADEAHRIANPRAARTKRMFRFVREFDPRCVFLSGTITAKSIKDYHHLSVASLKENNFLPNIASQAYDWGEIIDAEEFRWSDDKGEETTRSSDPGPLTALVDWAQRTHPHEQIESSVAGFRKAYKLRMVTAPGVVSPGHNEIGTTLRIANKPVQHHEQSHGWDNLKALIDKLEMQWLTPNDDEINHAFNKWKWMFELTAGFYNELVWPSTDALVERRKIGEAEAEDLLERAKEYHEAEQAYNSELRSWLETNHKPGLDTPNLVGLDMARNGHENVDRDLYDLWLEWKAKDFEGRPERDSNAVRVCPYKIDAAVEWAKHVKGGAILWTWNIEIGKWLYEALNAAGMDAMYCGSGQRASEAIIDRANADRKIVASIQAHGTGKNLQHFQHQCFVQWPRQAKTCQQVLGRLHRTGQKADEIEAVIFNTTEFDKMNFALSVNDALYIHQSTGSRQKLIYADYDPLPEIFPSEVLRERLGDAKILNEEQRRMLHEKFGQ